MKVPKLFVWFVIVSLTAIILTSCQTGTNATNQGVTEEPNLPTEVPEPSPEPSETTAPTDTPASTDNPIVDVLNVRFNPPVYKGALGADFLSDVTFSPDGDRLVFAGSGIITVLDMGAFRELATLDGHTDEIGGVIWTPDGNLIISGSLDGSVIMWDGNSYSQLAVLQIGPVFSLDVSPDGLEFVVGQESGAIQFWDIASNEMIDSIVSPTGTIVKSLSWSPDGGLIACGEESGAIHIIDSNSREIVQSLTYDESISASANSIEWSPDGEILASGHQNGQVFLWDTDNWKMIKTIEYGEGWVGDVTWLPNSKGLTISGEGGRAYLMDIDTAEVITSVGSISFSTYSSAWSPNGKILALACGVEGDDHYNGVVYFYQRTD